MTHQQVPENSFFSLISTIGLDNLGGARACTTYKKNHTLFYEGSLPVGVYCIQKGKVKLYKLGQEGKDHIIQVATNGDLLGYRALISEEIYPVSAETLEECTICFIPKSDFLKLLNESPKLYHKVLKEACRELGETTQKLTNLAQKTVRERLAIVLIHLHHTYSIGNPNIESVEIKLTREELANMVGTATETLIRLLNEFKTDGLVRSGRKKIALTNIPQIKKIGKIK